MIRKSQGCLKHQTRVFKSGLLHITPQNSVRYKDSSGQPVMTVLCVTKYSRPTCLYWHTHGCPSAGRSCLGTSTCTLEEDRQSPGSSCPCYKTKQICLSVPAHYYRKWCLCMLQRNVAERKYSSTDSQPQHQMEVHINTGVYISQFKNVFKPQAEWPENQGSV